MFPKQPCLESYPQALQRRRGAEDGRRQFAPPLHRRRLMSSASPESTPRRRPTQGSVVLAVLVLIVVDQAFERFDDLQFAVFLAFHEPLGQHRLPLLEDNLEREIVARDGYDVAS